MTAAAPFLFGKLPAHGDFVARGLSQAAQQAWDAWASQALQALRDAAGEAFDDAHEAAPPWRFVAGPSRYGDDWRAGALAPSIDSAGRRFLVVLGVQGWSPVQAAGMGLEIAQAAEHLIYRVIGSSLSADDASTAIQTLLDEVEAAYGPVAEALAARPGAAGVWWPNDGGPVVTGAEPPAQILKPRPSPSSWDANP